VLDALTYLRDKNYPEGTSSATGILTAY